MLLILLVSYIGFPAWSLNMLFATIGIWKRTWCCWPHII